MCEEEGFKGLMRGNGINCLRIVPYRYVSSLHRAASTSLSLRGYSMVCLQCSAIHYIRAAQTGTVLFLLQVSLGLLCL